VVALDGNELRHDPVGFFVGAVPRYEFKASPNPEYMHIYGEDWAVARKQQRTRYGFRAYSLKAPQKSNAFFEAAGAKERKVERSSLLVQLTKQLLDASRLLSRKSAATNGRFDRRKPRHSHVVPRRESAFQIIKRASAVFIGS